MIVEVKIAVIGILGTIGQVLAWNDKATDALIATIVPSITAVGVIVIALRSTNKKCDDIGERLAKLEAAEAADVQATAKAEDDKTDADTKLKT